MVRKGRLITPPVTSSILENITREGIMALASSRLVIEVQEREIGRTELYAAEELFFCGSSAEVTPILSVDRHSVGDGTPGSHGRELKRFFLQAARGEGTDEFGWLTPVFAARTVAPATVGAASGR